MPEKPHKILIAEDDPDARELLTMLLTKSGYGVIGVENGTDALKALAHDPKIELALLDWMMPGASGIQVVADIRTSIRDRYVYVIMVTALGSLAHVKTATDAGADDYVVKPFDSQEILERVTAGTMFATLKNDIARRLKEVDNDLSVVQNKISDAAQKPR